MLPSSSSRTETCAWASVPSVTRVPPGRAASNGGVRGATSWDGVENRVHRAVAGRRCGLLDAIDHQRQLRLLRAPRWPATTRRVLDLDTVRATGQGVIDEGDTVVVEHVLFLVGEVLEAAERSLRGVLAEVVAQRFQLLAERMAARMLARSPGWSPPLPDVLRPHDLVGLGVLEHPVLVDAGLVGEGVLADDGLVELQRGKPVIADT